MKTEWRTVETIETPQLAEAVNALRKARMQAAEQRARGTAALGRWNTQAALLADAPGDRSEYRIREDKTSAEIRIEFRAVPRAE